MTSLSAMRTIRVLHVIPGDGSGSSMIFARRQAASLGSGVCARTFFLRTRSSLAVLLLDMARLRRETRLFDPDLIHAQYGSLTALFCAFCLRRPLIVTYRGSDILRSSSVSSYRWFTACLFSQLASLRARRIICVSDGIRRALWWRAGAAEVIPTGVDVTLFQPKPQSEARRLLGWGKHQAVVLFNEGRDPVRKRAGLAKESVAAASLEIPDLRLEVLDGGVEPDSVPIYLNAANCLLCTSAVEGSPNCVKEAIACGLPVVSVSVGDVAERLDGVIPSRIVAPNVQSLADAIVEVIRLGGRSNGPSFVREISQDTISIRLEQLYREVLADLSPAVPFADRA